MSSDSVSGFCGAADYIARKGPASVVSPYGRFCCTSRARMAAVRHRSPGARTAALPHVYRTVRTTLEKNPLHPKDPMEKDGS
jgi:hypothetical protein